MSITDNKNKELNILLLSYFFPPFKRVGGRRWAKHCKYLNRMGVKIQVLCKEFEGSSPWDKDTLEYSQKITRLKLPDLKIPYHKKKLPDTVSEKIIWKLSLLAQSVKDLFITKMHPDESLNTASFFFEEASKIISKDAINVVILSIGPYRYSEALTLLKLKFPAIKFVLDDRDFWNEMFEDLDSKQLAHETKFQKKVISSVDLILNPYLEMKKKYELLYNKKVFWLPHCVDIDDLPKQPETSISNNGIIKLLYGGAFYDKIGDSIILIKKFIDLLSVKKITKADFYVSVKGYENELKHSFINRHDFIDSNEYFMKVQQSDFVILVLPPNRRNSMSSKFYELVALRKPILYFGDKGEISDYLTNHKLGYYITSQNIESQVEHVLENMSNQEIPNKSFDFSFNTFEHHTKLLVDELNNLVHIPVTGYSSTS